MQGDTSLRKSKTIIVVMSIVMTTALVLISLAMAQDGSGLSEVSDSENTSETARFVIEGSFDVTENGDVIETFDTTEEHWKVIAVPQLTLDDMPLVKVYYRPNNTSTSAHEMWRESGEALDTFPTLSVVYDEQSVLILYKKVYNDVGLINYLFNGEYKIVVIK